MLKHVNLLAHLYLAAHLAKKSISIEAEYLKLAFKYRTTFAVQFMSTFINTDVDKTIWTPPY